jgi:hypothetical protein
MMSNVLGGKSLIYIMDGLWATSMEHSPPTKFFSSPFYNNWSSSIFASLDPVAIESVGLDVMQKEYIYQDADADTSTILPLRHAYVQWDGIDDFLHQEADSTWWPAGIKYDPDKTGKPFVSMGVHEHWNDTVNMEYSRNLKTGQGIKLIKVFPGTTELDTVGDVAMYIPGLEDVGIKNGGIIESFGVYPNPLSVNSKVTFSLKSSGNVQLYIISNSGRVMNNVYSGELTNGNHQFSLIKSNLASGIYFCVLKTADSGSVKALKMVVN